MFYKSIIEKQYGDAVDLEFCDNADDGFKMFKAFLPDIIMTDVIMNRDYISGAKLVNKIRDYENKNGMQYCEVLIISAAEENDVMPIVKNKENVEFIPKPVYSIEMIAKPLEKVMQKVKENAQQLETKVV